MDADGSHDRAGGNDLAPLHEAETLPPTYDETNAHSHANGGNHDAPPSFDEVPSLEPLRLVGGPNDRTWLSKFGLGLTDETPLTIEILSTKEKDKPILYDLGPIHEAALRNDHALFEPLQICFACTHIDERSSENKTALHYACQNRCLESVKVLVSLGANVDALSLRRATPLALAATAGSLDIVKYLISQNAAIYVPDSADPLCAAVAAKHEAVALYLMDSGSSINCRDEAGNCPLHHAIRNGMVPLANALLNRGANPSAPNQNYLRPLHIAADKGFAQLARRLIDLGADVNATQTGEEWFTPLHYAAQSGNSSVVSLLLDTKANFNAKTAYVKFGYSHPSCAGKAWGSTPLHFAAAGGFQDIAKLLLDSGAEINERRWDMRTPLVVAVDNGRHGTVRLLLERKAKPEIVAMERKAAIHIAVENGDLQMLELLLDFKADVNAKAMRTWTPLHTAAEHGRLEAAKILVKRGVKVNAAGEQGETAMDVAEGEGHGELAEFLQASGGKGGKLYRSFKRSVHYGWQAPEWAKYPHVKS